MEIKSLDLGTAIDKLYELRSQRLDVEKVVKTMKSDELALRVHIKQMLDSINLDGAKGSAATAAVVTSVDPVAKDWLQIYEFIRENDAFDMLQKRLSSMAVKERWESGILVPGIEKFDNWDLSITKRSK